MMRCEYCQAEETPLPGPIPTPVFDTGQAAEEAFQQGEKYWNAKDYQRALDFYADALGQGHASAQNRVGEAFTQGKGVATGRCFWSMQFGQLLL